MTAVEDEVATKEKKKKKRHRHIGPNVRALKAGRAFCPMCDAERLERQKRRRED